MTAVERPNLAAYARLVKRVATVIALAPAIILCLQVIAGDFGWNPTRAFMDTVGRWAIRLFLLTMAVGPLHRLTGWSPWLAARRRLGVATFAYACVHVAVYVGFELGWSWEMIIDDLADRGAILVGVIALTLMLPLALTSWDGAISRIGGRAWRRLHWLAYPALAHAVYHFGLMVGRDKREALAYAGIVVALLAGRIGAWWARRNRRRLIS